MKAPSYIRLPRSKGDPVWVRVLAHHVETINGKPYVFVMHTEINGRDLLQVSEARTGYSLGLVRGAYGTIRRLSDGYPRAALEALCARILKECVLQGVAKEIDELPTIECLEG